ncbi:protein kinase [Kitasatospora misakiensis]|uniref:Protein kinase n=1 Tax=Kitasatospora misakiensis TaxID=67330 RepID=A0ABW0X133_9ACTN
MQPLAADDPRQVGAYRLLRRLGAGGMGRVYLGRTAGGRIVAVKVVRPDLAGDADFRARFRQEVAAARRVGGAWTAPVLDADTEGGHPWVATGYVAGPALLSAVREFGPLPEPAVRSLGVGLAEALAQVHGLGLVHRDVKPSNVLLTLDGPRLIDFGIARALDATTVLTQSGQVVGSPGFMSPEQANGLPAGPAGDVFSLGAVLAYAATGTMPFGSGVSAPVLLYRVVHEEPDLAGLAPGPLRSIVLDCLAKDPAARPTPGRLREWLDGDGSAAARLGHGDWLPQGLAAAVGRSAVQLLELEEVREEAATGSRAAPGFGPAVPPVPPGFGPVPHLAPPPSIPATRPVYVRAPQSPRGRAGLGALASAVTVVLLAGGGYLWVQKLRDDDRRTGGPGAASKPTPSAPATGASGSPSAQPTGESPSAPAARETTSDGPASESPDPTDEGSEPSPSATDPGPGVIPAKFLGTWTGERKAANGDVLTLTLTLAQSAPSERKSRIRSESAKTGTWCESAWTLGSADESRVVYASRLTGSSPGERCASESSTYRVVMMTPDDTLRYSVELAKPEEYVVLRKKG